MTLLKLEQEKEMYFNAIKEEWLAASEQFPDFLEEIPLDTKCKNEKYIEAVRKKSEKQLKSYPRLPILRKRWKRKTLDLIQEILYEETILGIHHSISRQTMDSFQEELKDFLRKVRSFAPEFLLADMGQAIRNYIVYLMFKEAHAVKSGFSTACFGYSMLYPVTDNFIDSENYTAQAKNDYNRMIYEKITGKTVYPKTEHEKKTCDLLDMIESDYPRTADATIYNLLLLMLKAQDNSLRQQNPEITLTAEERLDISIYKGGMSVLIDGYFANRKMTEEDFMFFLNFGFFLQLADDLQDMKQDREEGNQTIFTLEDRPELLEKTLNKLFFFVRHIMDLYKPANKKFKNLILQNCYQLLFLSIEKSKEYFSMEYLKNIEKYLPVSYSFFNDAKFMDLTGSKEEKYRKILDDMIMD